MLAGAGFLLWAPAAAGFSITGSRLFEEKTRVAQFLPRISAYFPWEKRPIVAQPSAPVDLVRGQELGAR